MKYQFTCKAIKWFDKVNGNTYHSARITRHEDGAIIAGQFGYGYGDQYRQTALRVMLESGWISKYNNENVYLYERENAVSYTHLTLPTNREV